MRTKNLYGINNKSSGVGVVRMYVMTCVINKIQMNHVHLQQFLPYLHNCTSANQLFRAQFASSKSTEIWQTLRISSETSITLIRFSGKLFTIRLKVMINRSIRTSGLWVTGTSLLLSSWFYTSRMSNKKYSINNYVAIMKVAL